MDFGDISTVTTELNIAYAIAQTRSSKFVGPQATGVCNNVNCGLDSGNKPFCNVECRDEYEKILKLRNRR